MGMSGDAFWSMSLLEWNDALAGFAESKGSSADEPFTRDELDDLMELYPDA